MKKLSSYCLIIVAFSLLLSGCDSVTDNGRLSATSSVGAVTTAVTGGEYDYTFSAGDLDVGYAEATATTIEFNGVNATINGNGAVFKDSVLAIGSEGVYVLSGNLTGGQIIVDANDIAKIRLVLNGVSITSQSTAAIYIKNADKVFITVNSDTENTLSDGNSTEYVIDENNVDGVIFSKADLTINGTGKLNISASYKHAVVSKDDLVIVGSELDITANGQGLHGKDCVKIKSGSFSINTTGDGIQSDNAENTSRGFVYIEGGEFAITSQSDGIQAETMLYIAGGSLDITTTDDSIHSNGNAQISGGDITITAGDDGIHADKALLINGGSVNILNSYEGLEGGTVTVDDGIISLVSSDDGINAAGGSDTTEGTVRQKPQDSFGGVGGNSSYFIKINGGTLTVDAGGDGLDSNGPLYITGGTVYVNGPTDSGNSALDCDGSAEVSGGTVIAVSAAGMAQSFGSNSTQCSILYNLTSSVAAGSKLTLTDSDNNVVVEYAPTKPYQSVLISSPKLVQGDTYTLSAGGENAAIELTGIVTSNGGMGGFGGGGGRVMDGSKPDGSRPERDFAGG